MLLEWITNILFGTNTFTNPRYTAFSEDWSETAAFYKYVPVRFNGLQGDSLLNKKKLFMQTKIFN